MKAAIEELLGILDLDRVDDDHFVGQNAKQWTERIYGGQVLAQALMAAGRTVEDWPAHSMHGYFLRAGNPGLPIHFEVDRIRDGRSFATRRVVALQDGQAIFNMSSSYHAGEPGISHQIDHPEAPPPESLPTEAERIGSLRERMTEEDRHWYDAEQAFDLRPVDPVDPIDPEKREPLQRVWMRTVAPVPEDLALQQCLLAFASDWTLLDTSILPHGLSYVRDGLLVASLDHAMWFHRPFRCDEWLLYVQDSPCANGARGYCRGAVYDREGRIVASVTQEGLVRMPRAPGS